MRLALKDWRVEFVVADEASAAGAPSGRRLRVLGLLTGYRAKELADDPALEVHRAFVAAFPPRGYNSH